MNAATRTATAAAGCSGVAVPAVRSAGARTCWAVLFALGLILGGIMAWRSQVGGDQLNLLARGWLLAQRGVWVPYGNRTSAGGYEPGGLTSVLVGAPLLVWADYRAPVIAVLALAAVGYLLIDRVLPRTDGGRLRIVFAILYWLNPWRLAYSGHLLNPNYLLFFAAVHLATANRMRHRPRLWPSLLHGATWTLAIQLHPSAVMLAFASAILVWRRCIVLSAPGAACGALLGLATVAPYVAHALRDPSVIPGGEGFIGRGLVFVFPVLRGVLYWLRYPSFAFSQKFLRLDFSPLLGAWARPLEITLSAVQRVLDPLTVLVAVAANIWLFTRVRRAGAHASTVAWLRAYGAAVFGAALLSFALSPTTIMSWQCLPAFHAAVLPLTLWAGMLGRTRWRRVVDRGTRTWCALFILFALAIAFGAPIYRSGGREPERLILRDHAMLDELGLSRQSDRSRGDESGARADVLTYP